MLGRKIPIQFYLNWHMMSEQGDEGSLTASCRQLNEFGKFYLVCCWQELSPWVAVNFSGWFAKEYQANSGLHISLWNFNELHGMERENRTSQFWFPFFVLFWFVEFCGVLGFFVLFCFTFERSLCLTGKIKGSGGEQEEARTFLD